MSSSGKKKNDKTIIVGLPQRSACFVLNLFTLCAIIIFMHLFLLLLFPLTLAIWLRKQEGSLPAKYFFFLFYFITPDSFWRNLLHVFAEQIFLPLAVLTAAFLFVFKKDKLSDRLEKIFPFYAGFYAVYLPFRVMNEALPHAAFSLFAKPIMYALMILTLSELQKILFVPAKRALLSAWEAAARWSSLVVVLVMPAAVEALWLLGMRPFLTILFLLLYSASAALAFFRKTR